MLAADIRVHASRTRSALLDEQRHLAGGRANRDLSLADDRLGDGLDGDRFGEGGGEAVQPVGPRGERAIARFARAQRHFGLLVPLELLVGAGPQRLRFRRGHAAPTRTATSDRAPARRAGRARRGNCDRRC